MQQPAPIRPTARNPDLAAALAAQASGGNAAQLGATLQSLAAIRSAFTPLPAAAQAPPQYFPEVALFSQFHQLFPQGVGVGDVAGQQQAAASRGGGRSRSGDSKSTSNYASRHQAAEQRRRTRINERWVSRE